MTDADAIPTDAPLFKPMVERFRGYLPVVVDVETGGFDATRHALLELRPGDRHRDRRTLAGPRRIGGDRRGAGLRKGWPTANESCPGTIGSGGRQ